MPEIDTIMLIVMDLNKLLLDSVTTTIDDIIFNQSNDYTTHNQANINIQMIRNHQILRIYNRGKRVVFELENKYTLIGELALNGYVLANTSKMINDNLLFVLGCTLTCNVTNEKKTIALHFCDRKKPILSKWFLYHNENDKRNHLDVIAKSIVSFDRDHIISKEDFTQTCKNVFKKYPNKYFVHALMDQTLICSGIGNYLLSEILFLNRLHPFVKCVDLSEDICSNLYDSMSRMLKECIEYGANYSNIFGTNGESQKNCKVYRKQYVFINNTTYSVQCIQGPHNRKIWYVPELQKEHLKLKQPSAQMSITSFFTPLKRYKTTNELIVDPVIRAMNQCESVWFNHAFENRSNFESLVSCIISQRISFNKSRQIRKWLFETKLNGGLFNCDFILNISQEEWKSNTCLTDDQVRAIQHVAKLEQENKLDLSQKMDGVGEWTIKSVQVMTNNSENVFIGDRDKWINNNIQCIYNLQPKNEKTHMLSIKEMEHLLHVWRGKCTNVSRFLWRLKKQSAHKVRDMMCLDASDFL